MGGWTKAKKGTSSSKNMAKEVWRGLLAKGIQSLLKNLLQALE
jgi:hypothetical protein